MIKLINKTKLIMLLLTIGTTVNVMAAGKAETMPANTDRKSIISMQKGAQTYMNYCAGCHSMQYMRYDALVEFLEIPEEIVERNLMFSGSKITDHITNNVPAKAAESWFGKVPPDLTLVARVRGVDWLYTFLKSYYTDEERPFGVNNTVFKDVGMPHILAPLQGTQVKSNIAQELQAKIDMANLALANAVKDGNSDAASAQRAIIDEASAALSELKANGTFFEIAEAGTLTVEEYDTLVRDLVNFLDFAGEPNKLERHALGIKVIIFLLVFFVLSYFLKKEYWRDVH